MLGKVGFNSLFEAFDKAFAAKERREMIEQSEDVLKYYKFADSLPLKHLPVLYLLFPVFFGGKTRMAFKVFAQKRLVGEI